ncbi:hypothetical protein RB653_000997 [Dictyostelium firmibasis]|uniref:DNA polymerase n=1 Tax=Dictyostelium firmibasis TaxID=79012 RepID=A0AAN7Z1Q5_9MYCE
MNFKNKNKKRERESDDEDSSGDEKIVTNFINKKQNKNETTTTTTTNTPLSTLAISTGGNKNQKLTDILTELSIFEKNKGLQHKYSAYRKAVQSIRAHPKEITSGIEAQKLDGVGKKIAKKIQEIIDTGELKKLNNQQKDETLTSIGEISKISGIGPKAAQKFFDEGIKSIKDLEKIKDRLTHHQQIGLKYFHEIEQKVPRNEIEEFEELVRQALLKIDKKIIYETCGSYRRGLPSSGDVDILLSHPNYSLKMKDKKETFHIIEKLVDSLKKSGIIIDDLSFGPLKYMGVCKLPSHIKLDDNNGCKKENYANYSDKEEEEEEEEDEDDCSTKKENNEGKEDETSDGEEFEEDSDATEPEDESKRLPPKKILKKKKVEKKQEIKKPKKTTTSTSINKGDNGKKSNQHITRRIDFKLIPIESYYFGLLHNTGSDEFNRQMRGIALAKGYTLSEYGINKFSKETGKDDQTIPVNSEEEIFKIIGMKYYPPQERNL